MSHPYRAAAALLALIPLLAATPAPKAAMHAHPMAAKGPKVMKMADGLQYVDLAVGKGAVAKNGQAATVNYTGTLTNGTMFDSSKNPGRTPFEFHVGAGEVIKCWDEGVAGMRVGGHRKLTCPAAIAYGPAGRPPVIPENATLLFDVELLGVK